MTLWELFLIAVGLSMDAFAVSVTNGMCGIKKLKGKSLVGWWLGTGLCFGLFQGLMPTIGYALGSTFAQYVSAFDHIIALVLLGVIGGKMIADGVKGDEEGEGSGASMRFGLLLVQGVATSIDALAVGVTFAAMSVNIVSAALFICLTTFTFSVIGVGIGKKFGDFLNTKAQIAGGAILALIGLKIFIEHTFFS